MRKYAAYDNFYWRKPHLNLYVVVPLNIPNEIWLGNVILNDRLDVVGVSVGKRLAEWTDYRCRLGLGNNRVQKTMTRFTANWPAQMEIERLSHYHVWNKSILCTYWTVDGLCLVWTPRRPSYVFLHTNRSSSCHLTLALFSSTGGRLNLSSSLIYQCSPQAGCNEHFDISYTYLSFVFSFLFISLALNMRQWDNVDTQ